jgi:cysteine synthase
MDLVDEIASVSDEEGHEMARRLATVEGILAGISSGANVLVALRVAEDLSPGHRVLTITVDTGLKYFEGDLYR